MGGGSSPNGLVRWLGTLYERGAIGGFSDARLVERFVSRDGTDREDAFSALVYRHGPMVQRVCRRMLSDPADADDAFQAVFLVLARKAGSLRRAEDLKSWLYGVAVRTSLEARKRRARLRAREGAPLDDARAAIARDDSFELRALLDEELNKLPNRFREPLLLCELEGISRREAARRLGLPEGTLSSRLARGRSLLRDRLTRCGVAVTALGAMFPAPVKAAAPADASLRLALKFAARDAGAGTVPAAVASLAEGVLVMFQAAKLKTVVLASSTLVAACLAAGLIAGRASPPAEAPRKAVAQTAKPAKNDAPREPLQARGVVVDESGNPVAGAEVWLDAYEPGERSTVTNQDGEFTIPAPDRGRGLDGRVILVAANNGQALGALRYGYNMTWAKAREPVRIVVEPGREIAVHVVDANQAPIEGAAVEAVGYFYAAAHATTGADGVANVRVPANIKVTQIVAQKGGAGFDYAEFGEFDETRNLAGVPAASLPGSLTLTLESPHVARIKAVDQDGKPMAGVEFTVSGIRKDGRRSAVYYASRQRVATTDADGTAAFDWLPPPRRDYAFLVNPVDPQFATPRPAAIMEGQSDPIVFTLVRNETIRGRVVMPDGTPAKGVNVEADGTSQGRSATRSRDDGTYQMLVPPNEAYAVHAGNIDWDSAARLDVVVLPGEPVDGVDFQLTKPTFITGTVTAGDDKHPAAGKYVRLFESGVNAPEDPQRKEGAIPRRVLREFNAPIDAEGRYKIRVGPGTYKLAGPNRVKQRMITVTDQAEIVLDLHILDRPKVPLSGRAIVAADGKPVAGARVDIISWNSESPPFTVTADAEGGFQADRAIDSTFLCAWSPDGSLGDLVLIGWEEREDTPEVVLKLAPTASATGLLLDEKGEPAANREIEWGRRTLLSDEHRLLTLPFSFAKVITDDQGRFTLPALVVGARYDIGVKDDPSQYVIGLVEADKAGPMDLGTIKIGERKAR